MNNIPLPKSNKKEDIDTTVIAIKNYLDDLRRQLGLDKSETTDLSGYATKAELQSAVNALEPVDTIELNNMKGVTSNAVALAQSYSTTPVKTGGKWVDGKDIWYVAYPFDTNSYTDNTGRRSFYIDLSSLNVEMLILSGGGFTIKSGGSTWNGLTYGFGSSLMTTSLGNLLTSAWRNQQIVVSFDKATYPVTRIAGYIVLYYTQTS